MALALALVAIVVGALVFHVVSPWWLTPIASNWQQMDDALQLTLLITGFLFVVINLFMAYAVLKFRHRDGVRASSEHGNKKLEWWLIGATSVGIIAMLAPGLQVYAKLIDAPPNAMVFEVMGQQWQWHYRLPGKDGKLGTTDVRFMSPTNPFGINPDDPNGQDDYLVDGQEIHIPVDQPVKVLLRAADVLHDFYVPQFRTRMNMVPGMVTSFWLTPTHIGRYEVMCAQLCGVGHANMRSYVVVDDAPTYAAWLAKQVAFRHLGTEARPEGESTRHQGQLVAQAKGCVACHSVDGTSGVGPSWKGLFGRTEALEGGGSVVADEAYLKESITAPKARIVKGFAPIMPDTQLSDADLAALVDYIKTVK
ncbi:MAG: cytochrome c oxidase subunit II [Pseudomonadota bacterium]